MATKSYKWREEYHTLLKNIDLFTVEGNALTLTVMEKVGKYGTTSKCFASKVGSWKRQIRLDADAETDIFKKHFCIYITVVFHT